MSSIRNLRLCLWFDRQAEEAAQYYVSIFKNSRITQIARYTEVGHEIHDRPAGSVMTVLFELDGHSFMALNGGPIFKFNEAISLVVDCNSQEEIDYYWQKLSAGGDSKSAAVRLAQRQIRPVVTNRASVNGPNNRRRHLAHRATRDGSSAQDEKAGYEELQRAAAD